MVTHDRPASHYEAGGHLKSWNLIPSRVVKPGPTMPPCQVQGELADLLEAGRRLKGFFGFAGVVPVSIEMLSKTTA